MLLGTLSLPASSKDKTKDWQLEILMEKLRSKAAQYKTLPEISKNVRMTLLVSYGEDLSLRILFFILNF